MMPVSPVIPKADLSEIIFAKDQPEFQPLPAYRTQDGTVLTRWKLTLKERLRVLVSGDIYHWQMTCGYALQPILLQVEKPLIAEEPTA